MIIGFVAVCLVMVIHVVPPFWSTYAKVYLKIRFAAFLLDRSVITHKVTLVLKSTIFHILRKERLS